MTNSCDSCTECCNGWLLAKINSDHVYPGCPCKHSSPTGCTIYKSRPEDPCRTFRCQFLQDKDYPLWMRPDNIKAIIMHKQIDGIFYYEMVECGQKLDSSALEFFLHKYISGQYENIRYNIHGHARNIGTQDFITAIDAGGTNESARGR